MSFYKHETLDEVLETCSKISDEIAGCTCPDEPHQNRMHDLATDLPDVLAATIRQAKAEALREFAREYRECHRAGLVLTPFAAGLAEERADRIAAGGDQG